MYRNGDCSDDSMSSDDLPRGPKCVRTDEGEKMDSEIKTKKGLNVWSEMLQEREITEGVFGNLDIRGEMMKVDRGVESYTVPAHQLDNANFERRPIQQYADVLFDGTDSDSASNANVSKGFDNEGEGHSHKGRGRYVRNRSGDGRKTRDSQRRVSSRSRDHSDDPYPGSQRGGFHARNRKRTWSDRRARAAFVSEEYSLDALMATKIPLGLDIDEVGERIAKALGERDGSNIIMAVRLVGETLALKLFEEARNVEASGGMLVVDGSRRRTPGGVFMALFKANPDVPQAAKAKMSNMQKASARDTRKTKCGESFNKEEAMLKPLLNATEVIRAECASEMSETKVENLETSIEDGEIADN